MAPQQAVPIIISKVHHRSGEGEEEEEEEGGRCPEWKVMSLPLLMDGSHKDRRERMLHSVSLSFFLG